MTRIEDLMSKHIVAVSKSTTLESVISLMKTAHVSVLPVLDGSTLGGIITAEEAEREVERWDRSKKVGELRLRQLFVAESEESGRAAKLMVTNKVARLPVVNNATEMKCVGIISSTEIARSHKKRIL